jgi:hypothetical protein
MPHPHLNGRHTHALAAIFQHPIAHNLEWHAVIGLLGALGTVDDGEPGGPLHVTINGEQATFTRGPFEKDVTDVETVMSIRHLLERAGINAEP